MNVLSHYGPRLLMIRSCLKNQLSILVYCGGAIPTCHRPRSYFTNTNEMKRDDPYAQLGLSWGEGATLTEIKQAYKKKSLDLHPDLNPGDKTAARKFADLQKAYQTLINVHSNLNGVSQVKDDEWRVSVWRNGDRIAIHRTDVAGVAKKRPAPSATVMSNSRTGFLRPGLLGHPDGRRGTSLYGRPAEYLGEDNRNPRTSSVGRGLSKWVSRQGEFRPWNGKALAARATHYQSKDPMTSSATSQDT